MREPVEVPAPPEGFVPVRRGPFMAYNGPIFHRPEAAPDVEQAFFILHRHTNGGHVLHGGMLSAFLDMTMGAAVSLRAPRRTATVSMSVDFMRPARAGEWVISHGTVTHATREIAFATATATVLGREIGRATGLFKLGAPI
jgi:uncharacterized protein (TIGR00369 family)